MQKTSPVKNQEPPEQNDQKLTKTSQARRSLDAPKPTHQRQEYTVPSSKLNQKDMDSACYRLSRVPQKFNTNKVSKGDPNQNYAQNYYANKSDVQIDTRPPKEKLEEIDKKLGDSNEDTDDNEKFDLLVQQKTLRSLVYGENSPEAVQSMTAMGAYYNEQGHPDSALRHLNKAKQTEKTVELSQEDSFKLAVELADANMHASTSSKQEKSKKVDAAEKAISPYINTETDDKKLGYRRDYLVSEIYYRKKKYAESVPFFEKAGDGYTSCHDEKTKELAEIYEKGGEAAKIAAEQEEKKKEEEENQDVENNETEIGETTKQTNEEEEEKKEKIDYGQKSKELYQKAISVYEDLGENELAEKLKPLVADTPTEENPDEQEEKQNTRSPDNEDKGGEQPQEENQPQSQVEIERIFVFEILISFLSFKKIIFPSDVPYANSVPFGK